MKISRYYHPVRRFQQRSAMAKPQQNRTASATDRDELLLAKLQRLGVSAKVVAVLVPGNKRVITPASMASASRKPALCLGSELWQTALQN